MSAPAITVRWPDYQAAQRDCSHTPEWSAREPGGARRRLVWAMTSAGPRLAVARGTAARYNCEVKSLPPRAPGLASSATTSAANATSPSAPVAGSRLSGPLHARGKLWLEVDGGVALSEWRVALLEAIDATGSLARAAEQLDVPYRTASFKLREIEERLGVRLLAAQSGGAHGGGSHLTSAGRAYVARWRAFTAGLDAWIDEHFEQAFGDHHRPAR